MFYVKNTYFENLRCFFNILIMNIWCFVYISDIYGYPPHMVFHNYTIPSTYRHQCLNWIPSDVQLEWCDGVHLHSGGASTGHTMLPVNLPTCNYSSTWNHHFPGTITSLEPSLPWNRSSTGNLSCQDLNLYVQSY
jgi:hypothetical protein